MRNRFKGVRATEGSFFGLVAQVLLAAVLLVIWAAAFFIGLLLQGLVVAIVGGAAILAFFAILKYVFHIHGVPFV